MKLGDWLTAKLSWRLRLAAVASTALLAGALFAPIWEINLYSNQYPDGLLVSVNANGFEAGQNGADLVEINTLNHYIGMRPLDQADIPELKWIGTAIVGVALLAAAAALIGRVALIAAVLAAFASVGAASMWMFYSRLYEYGHNLDPRAAVKVPPFTPPVLGTEQMANFTVESYPALGTYLMLAFAVALLLVIAAAVRARSRRTPRRQFA